jgi:hypothetical protein
MKNVIQPLDQQVFIEGTSGPKLPPFMGDATVGALGFIGGTSGPKLPPSYAEARVCLSAGSIEGPKLPPYAAD